MKTILYYLLIITLFISCTPKEKSEERIFVDLEGIDHSVKPGDNFFRYVNGKWYDTVKIADDQVGVGSYRFLNIPQKMKLQNILDEVASGEFTVGTIEQKVGDFYASGMDTISLNARGFEPIQSILDQIEAINDVPAMMNFVADQLKASNYSLIYWYAYPDDENSQVNMAHFYQTGIGLPDRDYYFKTDSSSVAIQNAYKQYLTTLFELTGSNTEEAANRAMTIYSIEKIFAKSHKTNIQLRDVKANYNKLAVTDLEKSQPHIKWSEFLKNIDVQVDSVDIKQPAYYHQLNSMLDSVSIADWKTYLKGHLLDHYANYLSKPFEDARFSYNKVITGQSTQKPRGQLMAEQVDHKLGYALGQLYVKKYFTEEAKQRALDLVNNLQKAFEQRMDQLDWMSDSTKLKAKEKLWAITKKNGYPDVWREYQVVIDRNRYFENIVALGQNEYRYELEKLNQPPDKTEWHTTPSTVTAYYNPAFNEIVFPAGILQYPYFDQNADDAINYGGIGMVIGHELTHAFDDRGAQRDKNGNVNNWWTARDYEQFKAKTQQMIDRYGTFTVLDTMHIKGALTVGENTADNGGIAIAYDAFKMTAQGQDTTRIDGLTPDQRFFYSIARIWRVKTRDEFLRNYVNTDPHSPAMWRVNGPLMNFTPFYEAYNIQPGDQNYRSEEERIKIW